MIQEVIPVGMLQCNCYVLGDEMTGEAVVIDPGDDIERVQEVLSRHGLTPKYLVVTHAHIDHVGGLEKLARASGAPALMHQADLPLYQELAVQAAWLGMRPPKTIEIDQFLREGDSLRWGARALQVLHTPGHSPGSVSLYLPGEASPFQRRYAVSIEHRSHRSVGRVVRRNPAVNRVQAFEPGRLNAGVSRPRTRHDYR